MPMLGNFSPIVRSLVAAGAQAATFNGAALDLATYTGMIWITQDHGTGTGTLTGKIQDSADGSTGWADIAGAVFADVTTTAAIEVITVNSDGAKRYIRYVGTIVTGPHNVGVSVCGIG